jgi:hypothetical protein
MSKWNIQTKVATKLIFLWKGAVLSSREMPKIYLYVNMI